MSAKSSFRDAVLEDGRYVLYQVTTRLYEGGDLRPDVYFKRNSSLRHKDYNRIFNYDQRAKIEYSGMPEDYDIESDARIFDVSIHALLAEHMCGLKTRESLYQKVKQVKNKRNEVAHPDQPISLGYHAESYCPSIVITDENLNENLEKLLSLYNGIIEDLEDKTAGNLYSVKMEIGRKVNQRKLQPQKSARMYRREERRSESDEMSTWDKVAVGTAIGAGALALLGALASSSTENRKKEENRRNQTGDNRDKDECVVM